MAELINHTAFPALLYDALDQHDAGFSVLAAHVSYDLVIRPGGVLRHREWGLYEVGIAGPDGMLVRIGWPSRLMQAEQADKA